MKKNVFTDCNCSNLIMVEGMGAYAPVHELDEAKRQIEELTSALDSIVRSEEARLVKDWAICGINTNSVRETPGREMRMNKFYAHYSKVSEAEKLLFMLENGLGAEDMKGGNREDV